MDLTKLGWDSEFSRDFEKFIKNGYIPARINRVERETYCLHTEKGNFTAKVSGKFRHEAKSLGDYPAIGDWVAVTVSSCNEHVIIHEVLNRKSKFSRKVAGKIYDEQVIAANIDYTFIVCGLDNDFNLMRIERYLTLTWNFGSIPIILLNKMDICDNIEAYVSEVESVAFDVNIHPISAKMNMGVDIIENYCTAGKTGVLIGSSGTGKSTIINTLLNKNLLKTNPVREKDSRGRHTTTHRELIILPGGGLLIDTPGIRELQLWSDEEDIKSFFSDIDELALNCRFSDCKHESEPGCEVKKALECGELDKKRFLSYIKIKRELFFLKDRHRQKKKTNQKRKVKKK